MTQTALADLRQFRDSSGIIDPVQTRRVLALGLFATLRAPIADTRFGTFRL